MPVRVALTNLYEPFSRVQRLATRRSHREMAIDPSYGVHSVLAATGAGPALEDHERCAVAAAVAVAALRVRRHTPTTIAPHAATPPATSTAAS